jgi:hypothetical protein
MSFRSQKLRDSAADKPCAFCGRNDGTTVPAHLNSVAMGKGTGIKCPDSLHARACQQCHDLYDGRAKGWTPEERAERFMWAYFRTVRDWFDEGIVIVK